MKKPIVKGSIKRRLSALLTIVAAIIAIFLYFLIQSVSRQIAQSSQDNILLASATSIIDSSRFNKGELSIDLPYSSLSMLDTVTDERVFYSIKLDNKFDPVQAALFAVSGAARPLIEPFPKSFFS